MDKETIGKAIQSSNEDNAIQSLKSFFSVPSDDDTCTLAIENGAERGVDMIAQTNLCDRKEDVRKSVEDLNVDEEASVHFNDASYSSAFTYKQSVEDFEDYQKWLLDALKVMGGEGVNEKEENATESKYAPFKTFVLTFSKRYYDRNALDCLTDNMKYDMAINDRMNCTVYEAQEYTNLLNSFKPMDRCVFTYIVNINM